jgi:hypothetical protein
MQRFKVTYVVTDGEYIVDFMLVGNGGVHGSVRFGFNLKIQPNWKIVFLINMTWTEQRTGSDRTNFVWFWSVF